MIEMNLLETLAAFDTYGTLSASSIHLHISQPALSRSMQKLEEELGVKLFERTKNRMALNSTGKLAASYARQILNMEKEMTTAVINHDRSLHTISVGYCAPSPRMEIPNMLSKFYPDIANLSDLQTEAELLKGLYQNRYTMIILSHPMEDPDLGCMYYGSEQMYFSVVPAHPVAVYKDQGVPFSALDGETFLQAGNVGIWENIKKKKLPHSNFIRESDLNSLNTIINSSTLPGFATDVTIRLFRSEQNKNRIFVPITDPEATIHFYCVYLKNNTTKLQKWIDYLKINS